MLSLVAGVEGRQAAFGSFGWVDTGVAVLWLATRAGG